MQTRLETDIHRIIPELSDIREDLLKLTEILLQGADAYREAILTASGWSEKLIGEMYRHISFKPHSTNLAKRIEQLTEEGVLPGEIASYFHTLRVFGNKARHRAEQITFRRMDVENILGILLRLLEWYYCEFEQGPRYKTIFRELPQWQNLAQRTLVPSGVLYLLITPSAGFVLDKIHLKTNLVLMGFVLATLVIAFLGQFRRTRRFIGVRMAAKMSERVYSHGALFFISLLVLLDAPLLVTCYTGIDPYGFFLLIGPYEKIWALIAGLAVNFLLSATATLLFFWIRFEWEKRKPTDYMASTFTSVLLPLGFVYLIGLMFQQNSAEAYLLTAFFPLTLAFLALLGYSHPENRLDLFTAKILFVLCIAFMTIGFVLAAIGLVYKLYEFSQLVPQNIFATHLWSHSFDWLRLGIPPDEYVARLKEGFTWMVLTASIYLELAVGVNVTMSIYTFQLRPAIDESVTP